MQVQDMKTTSELVAEVKRKGVDLDIFAEACGLDLDELIGLSAADIPLANWMSDSFRDAIQHWLDLR